MGDEATVPWFRGDAPTRLDAPAWGLYRGAVREGPAVPPGAVISLRHKRWIYAGIFGPTHVVGVAVVHIGYAANAFVYVGDLDGRRVRQWKAVAPAWAARVSRRTARWNHPGDTVDLSLPEGATPGRITAAVRVDGATVTLDATLAQAAAAGASVTCVAPSYDGDAARWNLTTKDNDLVAQGTLVWGSEALALDAAAAVDVTDAYPARHTAWRWASLAGRDRAGRRVGVNLCAIHNDSEHARENVLWLDGAVHPLGAARFTFDPSSPDRSPWRLSAPGVDLTFEPSGLRDGVENLGLVASRFVQPYGRFSGRIDVGGVRTDLDGVPGVVEDHDARW